MSVGATRSLSERQAGKLQIELTLLCDVESRAADAGVCQQRRRFGERQPVHSMHTLLQDLVTITKNRVVPRLLGTESFDIITRPTERQHEAFRLLDIRLA